MLRIVFLVAAAVLAACQFSEPTQDDRRSDFELPWVSPGEDIEIRGFVKKNYNDAYGAPYVMVWEAYADFKSGKQYAVEEGAFSHRCGDDANVTKEFALLTTTNELTIARNFEGVRGFAKIPAGVVRIQALVFSDRPCQVDRLVFRTYIAQLADESPQTRCEEQAGMQWDGNACVKGPRLLCEERHDFVFRDDECVPRDTGPAPEDVVNSAWRQTNVDLQWIFQFDAEGRGVFGFRTTGLTVQSGEVTIHTDFTIADDHILIHIGEVDELPLDAPWQANTLYYCHLRMTGEEMREMEWSCSPGGEKKLPELSTSVITFTEISSDDAELRPTNP